MHTRPPAAVRVMNIALLGPSGAGKGSHADTLCGRFNLRQMSTGDLFRANLRSHSALGILARKHLQRGELVPDEVVDAMVEEWCTQLPADQGALFDGFPRTIEQVRFLSEFLPDLSRSLDAVCYLDVPDADIVSRVCGRLVCRDCQATYHGQFHPPRWSGTCDRCGGELYRRSDDVPEMVQARLRVFRRAVGPVLDHYAAAGRLVIVPGVGSVADIDARLLDTFARIEQRSAGFATAADAARLPRVGAVEPTPAHLAHPTVDLVLLGGPGSGKGTQAARLAEQLHVPHIATGDLFRENLKNETELGKLAKAYMERGELVPDNVTDAMVSERLARADARNGFILDGFPRTLHQAHALVEMLAHLRRRLAGVLYIRVSDDEIVRRLSGRLICRQCQSPYHATFNPPQRAGLCDRCGGELYQRADDHPDTVRARLATFHAQTEPLIDFYRQAELLHQINGEGDVAAVRERSLAAVRDFGLPAS